MHQNRTNQIKKVELLAPAGNFEKLKIAVHYGADAVYLADKHFGLRHFSDNFSLDELKQAISYAHANRVKVYAACNIYSRNHEQGQLADYFHALNKINPDALIISDPGIFLLAQRIMPQCPIHISTQANTTNFNAALFWENLGAKRINIARELSLKEIKETTGRTSIEIEAFVHGAMCIAFSGRCLLSSYLADRESNRGRCAHPCRWRYALVEEQRPGRYLPINEDRRGTYILNSRDLCMIEHIPDLIESGVASLKIEGRMKGIYYLASTLKVYREAIDAYYNNDITGQKTSQWVEDLSALNHRGYSTGFFLEDDEQIEPNDSPPDYQSQPRFLGKVIRPLQDGSLEIDVRNKIVTGDAIDVLTKKGPIQQDTIHAIRTMAGEQADAARPGDRVLVVMNRRYDVNDLFSQSFI